MGIHLKLVNFDNMIASCTQEPIILNDLNNVTEADKDYITRVTTTVFDNVDVFSNEPTCECGKIKGGYNVNVICPNCKTACLEPFSQLLENRVWIRAPKGVDAMINPIVWTMLSKRFTRSGFNLVEWLCNTDYQPTTDRPLKDIEELMTLGVERGYNNFIRNFDRIFEALCSLKSFSRKRDDQLRELFRTQRDCLFSAYIPLPNKSLLILENTEVGRFMDPTVADIVDAIKTITAIDTTIASFTQRQRENRAIKTIVKLADYYFTAYKEQLAKKQGIIRKNVFGTRVHFSTRAVISSNTGPHAYDELWLAWGHGVTMLGLHLTNKLMHQYHYTPNQCASLLKEYTVKYHPLLDQLFQELIAESKNGEGLACVAVRNPSLSRSSMQRMRITKIKTEVSDPTISLSILSVNGFNADRLLSSNNFTSVLSRSKKDVVFW